LPMEAAMGQRDEIGIRGESIFNVRIMNFCGRGRPYFFSHFLGEKFKTLDFIVELLEPNQSAPYFFVQVRTTRQGYTTGEGPRKLKIRVEAEDVARMREYPAPTYLAGVDLNEERVFILSVDETSTGSISGVPTTYPLDCGNLKLLWDEVDAY